MCLGEATKNITTSLASIRGQKSQNANYPFLQLLGTSTRTMGCIRWCRESWWRSCHWSDRYWNLPWPSELLQQHNNAVSSQAQRFQRFLWCVQLFSERKLQWKAPCSSTFLPNGHLIPGNKRDKSRSRLRISVRFDRPWQVRMYYKYVMQHVGGVLSSE